MFELKKLKEIADWGSGGTPKSTNSKYYGGKIPWLIIGDLNDGFISSSEKTITEDGLKNSSAKLVPPNSILIAMYGSIGKLGINKIEVTTNQAIAFTKSISEEVYNGYLFYYLLSIRSELHSLGKGGTQQNISQTVLKEVDIPVPSLPTQHRIVEKIEELFSELDHGVENLKKAQKQLKTYRQAVLKDAFEGKLTKEWRKQQNDLPTPEELLEQIKAERVAHRKRELAEWKKEVEQWERDAKNGTKPRKPQKLSKFDENCIKSTDGLPNGWFYIPFEQIGYWQGGGTPSKRNKEFWETGTVAWVSPKDMKRKDISETEDLITENAIENSSAKWIKKGSILFVVRSGILRRILPVAVAKTNLTVNQDLQAFTSVIQTLPDYLYWYAYGNENSIRNKCAKDGTTVESIDSSKLKAYPIPYCSIEEQKEIVNEIESRLSVVDQLEQTINENLQKAEALRQSILKKAFNGRLV